MISDTINRILHTETAFPIGQYMTSAISLVELWERTIFRFGVEKKWQKYKSQYGMQYPLKVY